METTVKKYYLFIDESGDHGLVNIDPSFPIFVLCGIIISEADYICIDSGLDSIKKQFWNNKTVILHSRDIRKCEKEFQILFDQQIKSSFYTQINSIIENSNYGVVASAINKQKHINTYGRLSADVYELSLSFIVERTIFYLDTIKNQSKQLEIIIERRGKKEDSALEQHFQRLLARGTGYVSQQRLQTVSPKIIFKDKKDNINGLQMADLLAYPIARYAIDPNRANPSFEKFESKFHQKGGKLYGLKVFP